MTLRDTKAEAPTEASVIEAPAPKPFKVPPTPSLEAIEQLLRNRKAWPKNFRWDFKTRLEKDYLTDQEYEEAIMAIRNGRDPKFSYCGCAMGLATLVWGNKGKRFIDSMVPIVRHNLFIEGHFHNLRPTTIADRIAKHLAKGKS